MTTPAGKREPEVSLDAVRAGSPEALAVLYRGHATALHRLAYRITGTRHDAEDVVHDVFVGLPEALRRYEERGALLSWLKRVTARVALKRLRVRKRRREVVLPAAAGGKESLIAPEGIALQVALEALPEGLRTVVVLKEIEGYSHAEIGELIGISAGASRVRLARALRCLRKALED